MTVHGITVGVYNFGPDGPGRYWSEMVVRSEDEFGHHTMVYYAMPATWMCVHERDRLGIYASYEIIFGRGLPDRHD